RLEVEDGRTYVLTSDGYRAEMTNVQEQYKQSQDIILSVRPEELILNRDANAEGIAATVDDCVFLGLMTHYFVKLESGEDAEIIQESSIDSIIEPGTQIKLTLNTDKVNIFTADGSANMLSGVQNDCK
ncbi:MAG: TOBE domain-containing protein, partial [Clostridia bacterium]|nr:TOBE domain-containing protein [Clostridia bacterium]